MRQSGGQKCYEQAVTTLKSLIFPILFLLHYLYPLIPGSLLPLSLITSLWISNVPDECRAVPQVACTSTERWGQKEPCFCWSTELQQLCANSIALGSLWCGCSWVHFYGDGKRWIQGRRKDLLPTQPIPNFLFQPPRNLVLVKVKSRNQRWTKQMRLCFVGGGVGDFFFPSWVLLLIMNYINFILPELFTMERS